MRGRRRWARCTTCPVSPCGGAGRGGAGPRRREEAEAEPELGKSVPHRRDGRAHGLLHGCCPARPLHSASIWVSPSVCGVCLLRLVAPLRVYRTVALLWLGTGKPVTTRGAGEDEGSRLTPHFVFWALLGILERSFDTNSAHRSRSYSYSAHCLFKKCEIY